jgi:IS4 transposase
VAIHGERTSEIKTLRLGPWVKDRILLMDLGFYKHQLLARIAKNGGFFVTRLKESADPLFLATLRTHRGQAIELTGKRWSEIEPRLQRQVLDAEVELSFSRRSYGGKRSRDILKVRLVAVWNPEARRYHAYLTNIPPEVLDPQEIAALYGARWDIELVFKELKGRYALDLIKTTNPQIVEALIWVAILTLLVSRRLHSLIRLSAPHDQVLRYTQLRWATIFAENADMLLAGILKAHGMENAFEVVLSVYTSQALDPHVNRKRFRAEWWA